MAVAGMIQFDRDAALDRAAAAFWRKGYDATSVQDLEAATGLGRGSLYNAFGDKQALFLAALERYAATVARPALALLDDGDARAGVRAMLDALVARMASGEGPRGCLLVNACIASGGDRLAGVVADTVRAFETALEAAFRRAQATAQIPPTADPRALARFYCAVAQSLALMHKAGAGTETLRDVAAVAMDAWPR
jgi:TetR/AcrR family transcriptional regulator, transcriptional repressor for nem operon